MKTITPFLWFDHQAEEAAEFYISVFNDSRITTITHYMEAAESVSGKKAGSVMTVEFELEGQPFVALNGGPVFQHSPAISFVVNCDSQAEIDALWQKLSADPTAEQCGWLKDKFGVSWQIIPKALKEIFSSHEQDKKDKAMKALLQMKKIDIEALKAA